MIVEYAVYPPSQQRKSDANMLRQWFIHPAHLTTYSLQPAGVLVGLVSVAATWYKRRSLQKHTASQYIIEHVVGGINARWYDALGLIVLESVLPFQTARRSGTCQEPRKR